MIYAKISLPKSSPFRAESRRISSHRSIIAQTQPIWRLTRGASPDLKIPILKTLLSEKLNPLSLDLARFVVATDAQGTLAGFGQVKPLEENKMELSSLVVYPQYRYESISIRMIGYRFIERVYMNRRIEGHLHGSILLVLTWPADAIQYYCQWFSSALPLMSKISFCRGRGLGQQIVSELLSCAGSNDVYLITVTKRSAFYQRCGFVIFDNEQALSQDQGASEIPSVLRLEKLIGTPIAWAAAQDKLVVMRHKGAK